MSRMKARMARGVRARVLLMALIVATAWLPFATVRPVAAQAPPATTAAQDEFVPIDELPPEDRLPAAPFLVAAYTVTLVLLGGYVTLLWRRLSAVQRDLESVRRSARSRPGGAPM